MLAALEVGKAILGIIFWMTVVLIAIFAVFGDKQLKRRVLHEIFGRILCRIFPMSQDNPYK